MSIFKKKTEPIVLPQPKSGGKKVSVFDIQKQAYHEVSIEAYYSMLRGLGLSDDEAKAKVKQLGA